MELSKDFRELIEEIDVSDSDYEKAISRYDSITHYINRSSVSTYEPALYIQGSFKLGTAIKPLTDEGSYDIDIVCVLKSLNKSIISQEQLKNLVGTAVKDYAKENGMNSEPKNGKRCWTIDYVDSHNFHVDILPSIPNALYSEKEIAITDKKCLNYSYVNDDWEISNPKGYGEWFAVVSHLRKYQKQYSVRNQVDIEKIPEYKVKTPLQRVIQILKRHAEIMFEDNSELKPSSTIITTLAGLAYTNPSIANVDDFPVLMKNIISLLPNGIVFRDNKPCVLNPVDDNEDLSVKWKDEKYYNAFLEWVDQLKFDASTDGSIGNRQEEFNLLKRSLFRNKDKEAVKKNLLILPYHKPMPWQDRCWKEVHIKATGSRKGWKPFVISSGKELPKGIDLSFEVIADNLSLYNISWQITNTGYEAKSNRQLRGDFYESKIVNGKKLREESTRYTGIHYVEAFLIDDKNMCVGKSEPFVVNIVNTYDTRII